MLFVHCSFGRTSLQSGGKLLQRLAQGRFHVTLVLGILFGVVGQKLQAMTVCLGHIGGIARARIHVGQAVAARL